MLLGIILAVLVGWAFMAMAVVVIPLMMGIFVTLMVLPIDRAIAGRMPHGLSWLGRAVVMVMLLLIIALFLGGLVFCVQQIATHLPDVSDRLGDILPEAGGSGQGADATGAAALWAQARGLIESQSGSLASRLIDVTTSLAQAVANAMGVVLAGVILVLFIVLLALSEADKWAAKMDSIAGDRTGWQEVSQTLGAALRRFIATRAVVGVISAGVYAAWLAPFGVDLLMVWAVLTFLMTFIPNLGALVSGVFPTLYAFLTLDPGTALIIGVGLVVIEQVIGNWIDPQMQGAQIALSPLVILLAVVIWGWLWGVAGAFLGTPMTLTIMIVCNRVDTLRPVACLMKVPAFVRNKSHRQAF